MNQKHLLKFIKKTLDEDGKKKVCVKDGKELTLEEVFETYVWIRNFLKSAFVKYFLRLG